MSLCDISRKISNCQLKMKNGEVNGTKCSGDIFRIQLSSESICSGNFPWRRDGWFNRHQPLVPLQETGRQIGPSTFYLCLMSVLLLCSGSMIIGAAIWSIVHKFPYMYLTEGSYFLDSSTFLICSGILSIPCFWITWASHNSEPNYPLMPLLMVLLGFSIFMLSIGASLAMIHRSKMIFQNSNNNTSLVEGRHQTMLNETMTAAMYDYEKNKDHHWAWDSTQIRLNCCGVYSWQDWNFTKIPSSCHCNSSKSNLYQVGCLNLLAHDLSFNLCLLSGLACIVFLVQLSTILLASAVYLKGRLSV